MASPGRALCGMIKEFEHNMVDDEKNHWKLFFYWKILNLRSDMIGFVF